MALIPSAKSAYADQTSTADPSGYPYGKAQNQSTYGDGTGTPLEQAWINDLWGFFQALLVETGIVPSGTPDKADASQYKQAIEQLIAETGGPLSTRLTKLEAVALRPGFFTAPNGGSFGNGDYVSFAETHDPNNDYELHSSGQSVEVPRNGYYWVSVNLGLQSADEGIWGFQIKCDAATVGQFQQGFAEGSGQVVGRVLARITDHDTQRIKVLISGPADALAGMLFTYLTIEPAR